MHSSSSLPASRHWAPKPDTGGVRPGSAAALGAQGARAGLCYPRFPANGICVHWAKVQTSGPQRTDLNQI